MDGNSFEGIYDAFDSFERQMEEGLADIFDEDDPPSVTVAASATQSFQSIIGCAWQKYLIEKCHLSKEHGTNAMQIGMLDLLCINPIGEVEEYGIPYLRSILEKDASKRDREMADFLDLLSETMVAHPGISQERGGDFLLSPASAPGEVLISIFDWTVSVTRNDFLVSSKPNVGILI